MSMLGSRMGTYCNYYVFPILSKWTRIATLKTARSDFCVSPILISLFLLYHIRHVTHRIVAASPAIKFTRLDSMDDRGTKKCYEKITWSLFSGVSESSSWHNVPKLDSTGVPAGFLATQCRNSQLQRAEMWHIRRWTVPAWKKIKGPTLRHLNSYLV